MSIFQIFDTANSGLRSQREAMSLASENVANMFTPNYKAKSPVFAAKTDDMSFSGILTNVRNSDEGLGGVLSRDDNGHGNTVAAIAIDQTDGVKVYSPYHPKADKNGYVEMSNVDGAKEMLHMMDSLRAYKANLSIVEMAKKAAQEAMNMTKNA